MSDLYSKEEYDTIVEELADEYSYEISTPKYAAIDDIAHSSLVDFIVTDSRQVTLDTDRENIKINGRENTIIADKERPLFPAEVIMHSEVGLADRNYTNNPADIAFRLLIQDLKKTREELQSQSE